jgi:hypothetical protein
MEPVINVHGENVGRYHVHFGVAGYVGPKPDNSLPAGFITDGDSFLTWGEQHETDGTLHIIGMEQERPTWDRVTELRKRLAPAVVGFGERLFDYVVVTTAADWCTLDNAPEDTFVWTPREGEGDLVY